MHTATLLTLALVSCARAGAPADTTPSTAALEAEIARIAAESGGTVGVAAIHVESGERVAVNGRERFPMQSVYKVPIALQLLKRVEAGEVDLDQRVAVAKEDLRPGHSPMAEESPRGGEYTVRELLRRMVSESDNTASDVLLRLAGGPSAVTHLLWSEGWEGILVSRPEGLLALEFHAIPPGMGGPHRQSRAAFDSVLVQIPMEMRKEGMRRYLADPRDTSTPEHMAALLVALQQGRLLTREHNALLLRLMTETPTGPRRLKGRLPAGTAVAHKTGTSGVLDGVTAVVNDVGIVTLPGGRGHVALAVFVKGAARGTGAAEDAIARISRAVYDHWTRPRR
jgi:beta-lactamase class A